MARDKQEIEAGLINKGFQKRTSDHNYFIYHSKEGKKSLAKTKTSLGRGFDIGDPLLAQMARQCGITKKLFLDLVDCPLDRDAYEKLLREGGKL